MLIDTGATECTVNVMTMAILTQKNEEDLRNYLNYLAQIKTQLQNTIIIPYGPPFKYWRLTGFAGIGRWALYIENVKIYLANKYYFKVRLFTALNCKMILGMPFLKNVKIILDRQKKHTLVLFRKNQR